MLALVSRLISSIFNIKKNFVLALSTMIHGTNEFMKSKMYFNQFSRYFFGN